MCLPSGAWRSRSPPTEQWRRGLQCRRGATASALSLPTESRLGTTSSVATTAAAGRWRPRAATASALSLPTNSRRRTAGERRGEGELSRPAGAIATLAGLARSGRADLNGGAAAAALAPAPRPSCVDAGVRLGLAAILASHESGEKEKEKALLLPPPLRSPPCSDARDGVPCCCFLLPHPMTGFSLATTST
uniref:Uncharacterized protein n=1 Tax=Triticum urartu TaxID=4572 RepID=A0A8R7P7V3_TRIUA